MLVFMLGDLNKKWKAKTRDKSEINKSGVFETILECLCGRFWATIGENGLMDLNVTDVRKG